MSIGTWRLLWSRACDPDREKKERYFHGPQGDLQTGSADGSMGGQFQEDFSELAGAGAGVRDQAGTDFEQGLQTLEKSSLSHMKQFPSEARPCPT